VRAPRRVNPAKCIQQSVPTTFYDHLKWGEDYQAPDGKIIRNDQVTEKGPKAKSYAYSADTIFDETLIEKLQGVDMLYHETTYLKDLAERAASRFHSTTVQAACIAKRARVGRLLIGHFSSKYEKLDIFQQEAVIVYPNTDLAIEGVTYTA
jgi:ribonuclease Z